MTKKKRFAAIPASPQPGSLTLRDHSERMILHLVECLYDHICTYHTSPEAARAALDFTTETLHQGLTHAFNTRRAREGSSDRLPATRHHDKHPDAT